jgi:preprotein translocase subunit SecY
MASPTLPKVRYLSVLLGAVQAFGIAIGLEGVSNLVSDAGWFFRVSTVITLIGGTVFLTWLAEQVTSRGLGKGIPLIVFAESVTELPSTIPEILELDRQVALSVGVILVAVIGFIVFMERAHRRLLVRKFEGGQSSHLSLKLNTAEENPAIFASSLLLLPVTIANFGPENAQTSLLGHGTLLFFGLYVGLIVFFAFFYTAIFFNPTEVADNLKKQGGFIPGISPGERTAEYIDYVLTRTTVVGATYIAVVCLIPEILISYTAIPFYLGGAKLFVVVVVSLYMIEQIQHVAAHRRGKIKILKLGGRRGLD